MQCKGPVDAQEKWGISHSGERPGWDKNKVCCRLENPDQGQGSRTTLTPPNFFPVDPIS